jgi:orotate phosphoribosyltransferase-like protein
MTILEQQQAARALAQQGRTTQQIVDELDCHFFVAMDAWRWVRAKVLEQQRAKQAANYRRPIR